MQELSLNNCRLDKRYDIREQLGRGSYAEIYLARDILANAGSAHREVVIKALNVFLQNDLDADLERTLVENFQNEAIALDRVRHPNIISRMGHGTARDLDGTVFHYLVLEYLSGGDLQNLIRKQKISVKKALGYIEQICAGLAHAHGRGIIHRDIKPQNLLLTTDLVTVKIADFGVARVDLSDSPITRVGTNLYAPPEHSPLSAGHTAALVHPRLTESADLYSLAKTVYTLLTGETPRQYANRQVTSLPASVKDKEWAGELLQVLERATTDDPRQRHQTVEEFWTGLAAVRQIVEDGQYDTGNLEVVVPQPHVSRGYSPVAPARPSFESVADVPSLAVPGIVSGPGVGTGQEGGDVTALDNVSTWNPSFGEVEAPRESRKRPALRRFAIFAIFVGLFAGILYGTASYMRGRGVLPVVTNPFAAKTAVANTDIYLRPEPSTDNDPIGLVTKNSKVRIVNTRNNWYQVDVIEQGRVRPNQTNTSRGWLNGKYLDIASN